MLKQLKSKKDGFTLSSSKGFTHTNSDKSSGGFTIIEVLIVLAIAALILVIVFLAVPALQRSSRNTQRKNDIGNMLSGISDYVSNAGGAGLPASGTYATAFADTTPKLSYYTTAANVKWVNQTTPTVVADPASADKVVFANDLTCVNNAPSATNATLRTIVAVYDVEGSNGLIKQCQQL